MINKQKVDIEEYRPPQDESGESSEEEHEEAGAIKVTKLPPGTTEEAITLFFENRKKSGGGEVEKVEYDEANHSAVVWFTEAEGMDLLISIMEYGSSSISFTKKVYLLFLNIVDAGFSIVRH